MRDGALHWLGLIRQALMLTCGALIGLAAPGWAFSQERSEDRSIEEVLSNLVSIIKTSEIPPWEVESVNRDLDEILAATNPNETGAAIENLLQTLFMLRTSGSALRDQDSIEATLHYVATLLPYELHLEQGMAGALGVVCLPASVRVLSPGVRNASMTMRIAAIEQILGGDSGSVGSVGFRLDVVSVENGEVVYSEELDKISIGEGVAVFEKVLEWDGRVEDGAMASEYRWFVLIGTVRLLSTATSDEQPGVIDQASSALLVRTVSPDWYATPANMVEMLEWKTTGEAECRFAQLPTDERSRAELVAQETGEIPGKLFVEFSRVGTVTRLYGAGLESECGRDAVFEECANAFLSKHFAMFGLRGPTLELEVARTENRHETGVSHFSQLTMDGLPVFDRGIDVLYTSEGHIRGVSSNFAQYMEHEYQSTVTADEALHLVGESILPDVVVGEPTFELGLLVEQDLNGRLAWRIKINTRLGEAITVHVDASSAEIISSVVFRRNDNKYEIHEYLGYFTQIVIRSNPYYWMGSFPGTSFVIYSATEQFLQYLDDEFDRDGWDDAQMPPQYHRALALADYNDEGEDFADFGGENLLARFGTQASCPDIIGHEFGHGVSYVEAEFVYEDYHQSGAIEEAYSDVLSQLAEKDRFGTTDWILGTVQPFGGSCDQVRSLADPESTLWLHSFS